MIYKTSKKWTTHRLGLMKMNLADLIWRLHERKSISGINASGKRPAERQTQAGFSLSQRLGWWLEPRLHQHAPQFFILLECPNACLLLLHSFCVLSGKLLALADDTPGSLSQNNNGVYAGRREPEDGVVHNGKFGVVGGHQHSFISQEFGSQQVQDSMPFPHKLDNSLILRLLDNLQIH